MTQFAIVPDGRPTRSATRSDSASSAAVIARAALAALAALAVSGIAGAQAPGGQGDCSRLVPGPPVSPSGAVTGRVHTSDGAPVAGAQVTVAACGIATTTASDGAYVLPQLPAGIDTLLVRRAGYDPLTLAVIVPARGEVSVDLLVSATPVTLPTVKVVLRPLPPNARWSAPLRDPGGWRWDGDTATSDLEGEPDVLRRLAPTPGADARPDGTGLRFLGSGVGAPSTRITVDGLPVWGAAHAGGLLGAVTPDLIGSARLYDGTATARYGAALAGVLDVQTAEGALRRPSWGAAATPFAVRGVWGSPIHLANISGDILLAGRRSGMRTPLGASAADELGDPWSDLGGIVSLRRGRDQLRLVALGSRDDLRMGGAAFELPGDADSTATTSGDEATDGRARLPWRTSTLGAIWTEQLQRGELQARVWRSTLDAARDGIISAGATSDAARSTGAAVEGRWDGVRAGASVEALATDYTMLAGAGLVDTSAAAVPTRMLALRTAPTVVAAFAEQRWYGSDDRWTAAAGFRATALAGTAPALEPRLALSARLPHDSRLALGYTRTHDYVQSLWSGTPALDALIPVALPLAASPGTIPTLTGSLLTAALSTELGDVARLDFSAYERSFEGLVVSAAAATARDKATSGAALSANGRSSGAAMAVSGTLGPALWKASYALARVDAVATVASTAAARERRTAMQDAAASLTVPLGERTELRMAGWLGSPESAPLGETLGIDQHHDGDGDAARESLVREDRLADGLVARGAQPLPPYFRLDLTAARHWRIGSRGVLDASLTLANVLGRSNLVLSLHDPGEGRHALDLTPRSLVAGLAWRVR